MLNSPISHSIHQMHVTCLFRSYSFDSGIYLSIVSLWTQFKLWRDIKLPTYRHTSYCWCPIFPYSFSLLLIPRCRYSRLKPEIFAIYCVQFSQAISSQFWKSRTILRVDFPLLYSKEYILQYQRFPFLSRPRFDHDIFIPSHPCCR